MVSEAHKFSSKIQLRVLSFLPFVSFISSKYIQLYILINIDDILVTGNDLYTIQNLLLQLQSQLKLKQLGNVFLFLGKQVIKT